MSKSCYQAKPCAHLSETVFVLAVMHFSSSVPEAESKALLTVPQTLWSNSET